MNKVKRLEKLLNGPERTIVVKPTGELKTQPLPDIQQEDSDICITKVGVRGVKVPIVYEGKQILATCAVYSKALEKRGVSMSRYLQILTALSREELTLKRVTKLAEQVRDSHNLACMIKIRFPIWKYKNAPISRSESISSYECEIIYDSKAGILVGVEGTINTVCPCSLAMSKVAAHNQRSLCNIKVSLDDTCELTGVLHLLCDIVDKSSSYEIFNVLKREDEKYVTERMFENALFVEDSTRTATKELRKHKLFKNFSVVVESLESVHSHNALAIFDSRENLHGI